MVVGKVASLSYEDKWGQGALLRVHGLETPPCLFNSLCRRNLLPRFASSLRGGGLTCFVNSISASFGKPHCQGLSNKHDSWPKCQQSLLCVTSCHISGLACT